MQDKLNVNINTLPDVICSTCGSKYWESCFVLKRVSPLISPNGQEGVINIPVLICHGCGQNLQENLGEN